MLPRVFVGQGAGSKGKGAKSGNTLATPGAGVPGMKQKEQKQVSLLPSLMATSC